MKQEGGKGRKERERERERKKEGGREGGREKERNRREREGWVERRWEKRKEIHLTWQLYPGCQYPCRRVQWRREAWLAVWRSV